MIKNINTDKFLNVQNIIKKNNIIKTNTKNNLITNKTTTKLNNSEVKKVLSNKFNDQKNIIEDSIAPWILKEVAKYPKGTFKRVNKEMIVDGKKVKIIFEGVKTDFDITSDGRVLQKLKKLL